jgi:hemolysin activation/secretion protein
MSTSGESMKGRRAAYWACALALAFSSPARPQAAPNKAAPGPEAVEAPRPQFTLPAAQGVAAPEGAEAIEFDLGDIIVEGQFPGLEARSQALVSALKGRKVSVADLYAFAAQLQQAYFDAGYPLARVIIPPQSLGTDGRVRVLVVDGFIEAIDTTALVPKVRARVDEMLRDLVGRRQPTRALLERRLLLAGDIAGLALGSTITPGATVGGAVLVLTGTYDPVSAAFSVDNRVDESLGRSQMTGSLAANSPFGGGGRAVVTVAGYPGWDMFSNSSRRRYLSLRGETPVGTEGLTPGLRADYSSTRPGGAVAAQELFSEYSRIGATLSYPLVRSRSGNLFINASFDAARDSQQTSLAGPPDTPLSLDRTRVIRLGLEGDARSGRSAELRYGLLASFGIDALGARSADDATSLLPLSRQGADASFRSLEANVSMVAGAPLGTTVAATLRGATGFGRPLLRSEQFSPAGRDGLSGPPPGLLVGDRGLVGRLEVARPWGGAGDFTVLPYVFGTTARVWLERPTALERGSTDAREYGAGVRLGLGSWEPGSSRVSLAFEVSDLSSEDEQLDRTWVSAALTVWF